MKKVFSGIIIIVLLVLSGCEGTPFKPDFAPVQAFTLTMTATVNGKEFQAALRCRSYEEIEQDTGLSQGNIRIIVMRTKKKLKQQFQNITKTWTN